MGPDETLITTQAAWMEWPAEQRADVDFDVRVIGFAPGCYPHQELRIGVNRVDASVYFRTVWEVEGEDDGLCLRDPAPYDTLVTVDGLPATADRTFDFIALLADRDFVPLGTVLVRPSGVIETDRVNAAGSAVGSVDIEGCAMMQPPFGAQVPVENPPQVNWAGFVRGYFFTPPAPLCGQTRAFHIEAMN
jgi:hypothetical protein